MIANALHVLAAVEPEPGVDNTRAEPVLEYLRSRIGGRIDGDTLFLDFITVSAQPAEHIGSGVDVYIRVFGYAVWGVLDWNERKLSQLISVIRTVNRIVHEAAAQQNSTVEHFQARIGMELHERVQSHTENQLYHIRGFRPFPYHKFWNNENYKRWMKKSLEKLQRHQVQAAAEPTPESLHPELETDDNWYKVVFQLPPQRTQKRKIHGIYVNIHVYGRSISVEPVQEPHRAVMRWVNIHTDTVGHVLVKKQCGDVSIRASENPELYRYTLDRLFDKYKTAEFVLSYLLNQIPVEALRWVTAPPNFAVAATEPAPEERLGTWSDVVEMLSKQKNHQYHVSLRGVNIAVRVIPGSKIVYVEAVNESRTAVTRWVRIMIVNSWVEIDASASTIHAHQPPVLLNNTFYQINIYELFRKFHNAKAALVHLLHQIPVPVLNWLQETDPKVEAAAEPELTHPPQNLLAQLYRITSRGQVTVTVDGVPVHFATKTKRPSPRISYGDTEDYRIISTDGNTKYSILLPIHDIPIPYIAGEQPLQLMHRLAAAMVRWHRK